MKSKDWKYKVGTDLFSFIPLLILLLVFGGVSLWLYLIDNGAVLFTGLFTAVILLLVIYSIYRYLFIKILVYEDGFYCQTKIGNGKYYKYSDIAQAWQSQGIETNGAAGNYFNFRTTDGDVIKFYFLPSQDEGIDYILTTINGEEIECDE